MTWQDPSKEELSNSIELHHWKFGDVLTKAIKLQQPKYDQI